MQNAGDQIGQHHAARCFQKAPPKREGFTEEGVFNLQVAGFWNRNYWTVLLFAKGTIQLDSFLVTAKESPNFSAFMFCRKWKIIELNYFIFDVLGSIHNSSGVLSLCCVPLGQLAAELDSARCFHKWIEMSNMNDSAQIFSKLLY